MSFCVLQPGTGSFLVDGGRPGYRHRGIPAGGAADRAAWQIGNALIGNSPEAVALEITLSGPTLECLADNYVCLFGSPFRMDVDGETVSPAEVLAIRKGQLLRIGGTPHGARGYLCVPGGFDGPVVLHSCSSLTPLAKGTVLPAIGGPTRRRSLAVADGAKLLFPNADESNLPLRLLDGPQANWFPQPEAIEEVFEVSTASNRMGIRLNGRPLLREPREMVSEPVAPGTVQVTNEGQCIVLGVDGQTIGGYPKIAQLIGADMDRVAQLRPGQRLQFRKVTLEEAEQAARRKSVTLTHWLRLLMLD